MLSILKGPYLQWPTPTSMTIMWETSGPSSTEARYWQTQRTHNRGMVALPETQQQATGAGDTSIHNLVLEGLEPETLYRYLVRSADTSGQVVESAILPFKTAVRPETPFSFAVTSESGGYGDDQINRRLFPLIQSHRPDFLLMVGDAVSHGKRYEDWDLYFFAPAKGLLHSTPFYLCWGNHEERASWARDFVAYPEPKNHYSFDYGNTHFTALDCTALVDYREGPPVATAELQPGSAQWRFLEADLAASGATWKVVFFHYPPYVSADYEVEALRVLCPVLEAHGVDLVFNSHTIVYERSHPLRQDRLDLERGIVYMVAGGAGAKPEWFHPKRSWHTARAQAVPHFVEVVVAGPTLEVRAIDEQGHLFDTFHMRK